MTADTVTPTLLSARLREGTRAEHERAESSGFISRLMAGELDVAAYADLAAQQLVIYRALERATEVVRDDERGRTLVFDELARTTSIESDLTHLVGPDWATRITIHPATQTYADRIDEVGGVVTTYAAHAYTRYLGDLSGGQIVRRMLERHYGLGPEVLAFYTFVEIPKAKPFKDVYRDRLDALGLDDEQAARAVTEAQLAFRLNSDVFADLGTVHCR